MWKIKNTTLAKVAVIIIGCHLSLGTGYAQRRGDCTPLFGEDSVSAARGLAPRRLPTLYTNWDANRIYQQAVILVSFTDCDFSMQNPHEFYDSLFNYPGFNKRQGPGCIADYYREQSGGLFNPQFDVYGPIKVSSKAQPYEKPDENTRHYASDAFAEATQKVIDSLQVDFSPYDWNSDGKVNQVIFVAAGYTGNQSATKCYGYVWPNTSSFSTITTNNNKRISSYTASAEKWSNDTSCGIGTICHEFTHSLGLPDIYPTSSDAPFSTVDEWDLMDGGNFTNYGWCPPNYSALEKYLLGWLTPIDLTESTVINGMQPVSEGGEVYRIKHTDNEYYLLENRQWSGWDSGLPGKGLVIFHVNYDQYAWSGNRVNRKPSAYGYSLMHADNRDFDQWTAYVRTWQTPKQYANSNRMNSNLLSLSPYPYGSLESGVFVNELTDTSVPAAKMFNTNSAGSLFLSKPITDIVQNDDGTVSFKFGPKCAPPTISYVNGQLHFECETEGATFVSNVIPDDFLAAKGQDITLTKQYTVVVYAQAQGFFDSDPVTATIKWGDGNMETENITVVSTEDINGDVNNDGAVDVADISSILTIMAGDAARETTETTE